VPAKSRRDPQGWGPPSPHSRRDKAGRGDALRTLTQGTGAHPGLLAAPQGWQGDHRERKASRCSPSAGADAGEPPASGEGSSPRTLPGPEPRFAGDRGGGRILAARPGPAAPPAPLLCSEVLGRTSEESRR